MLTVDRKRLQPAAAAQPASPALEWLWQYFRDTPRLTILDCGPLRRLTLEVLLPRAAKLYVADLTTPLIREDARFWNRNRKVPAFRVDELVAQLPSIPPGSLGLALCWQLMDLVPRDALAPLILELYLKLQPGGVLFCLLREPQLDTGMDAAWRLESLTTLRRDEPGAKSFPYPAVTNREVERLIPTGSIKTFLTRSGIREVLAVK